MILVTDNIFNGYYYTMKFALGFTLRSVFVESFCSFTRLFIIRAHERIQVFMPVNKIQVMLNSCKTGSRAIKKL